MEARKIEKWEDYGIKVRKAGEKSWAFLTPAGGTTRLKVHASRFTSDNAALALIQLEKDNPGYQFRRTVL